MNNLTNDEIYEIKSKWAEIINNFDALKYITCLEYQQEITDYERKYTFCYLSPILLEEIVKVEMRLWKRFIKKVLPKIEFNKDAVIWFWFLYYNRNMLPYSYKTLLDNIVYNYLDTLGKHFTPRVWDVLRLLYNNGFKYDVHLLDEYLV